VTAPAPKTTTAQYPVRCIQRPTGEWFTFAPGNAPGKDTPEAPDLYTEAEARERLRDLGFAPQLVEQSLAWARKHAEVSGDSPDWNTPPPGSEA
jgi:hypothetical protein